MLCLDNSFLWWSSACMCPTRVSKASATWITCVRKSCCSEQSSCRCGARSPRSTNDFVCVDYLGARTLGTSRLLETQTPPVTAATSSGLHHKRITAASCKAPRYSSQLRRGRHIGFGSQRPASKRRGPEPHKAQSTLTVLSCLNLQLHHGAGAWNPQVLPSLCRRLCVPNGLSFAASAFGEKAHAPLISQSQQSSRPPRTGRCGRSCSLARRLTSPQLHLDEPQTAQEHSKRGS